MQILTISKTDKQTLIEAACQTLASGGLVIYPTETMYGIGADATNQDAVNKLLQYKSRREGKPLSIAVADKSMAGQYAEITEQANNLYDNFLPGPITVVSMAKAGLAKGVASERGTVGIRLSSYDLVREIVAAYGKPMTSTSANASYQKRPYNVSDIFDNISTKQAELIDLALDAGQLPRNEPSTVVDTTLEQPTVLRQGDMKLTQATILTTASDVETQELGKQLIGKYRHYLKEKAVIFALVGEMGAGKTQLSKGIAAGLGVTDLVTSPTYTISNEYQFTHGDNINQFIHIDTWRIFSDQEFIDLGFKEMVDNMAIISIEWADKVIDVLKEWNDEAKVIWVKMEYGETENERIITYSDEAIQ